MDQSLKDQMDKQEAALDEAAAMLAKARAAFKKTEAEHGVLDPAQKDLKAAQDKYLEASRAYNAFIPHRLLPSKPLARAAYSDRMAWIMAWMAKLVYVNFELGDEEYERLKLHLQSGGFELVRTFNQKEMQAMLVRNKDFAVLAFRGTQPTVKEDVLADLKAYKTPTLASLTATINKYKDDTAGGKLHAGFVDGYNALALEILDTLTLRENSLLPLYITGHSLGGALATVATYRLEKVIGDRIAACYTYGSPRVGNGDYKKDFKSAIYRMVHSTDIVTLVPSFGYSHAGDPRFISFNGEVFVGIPILRRGWEMLLALFFLGRWVGCHDISKYAAKLGAYAERRNPQ